MTSPINHNSPLSPSHRYLSEDRRTMTSKPKVYALIVAAGKGSRFGASIPKQYITLQGKTILERSINALCMSKYINAVHLVIAKNDEIARTLSFEVPIDYIEGGSERWQSVQNGVDAIIKSGASAQDLILIHDAARPCVLSSNIDTLIEISQNEPYGAILGVPVADTLKVVAQNHTIESTVDRTKLWHAQTPQVFRAGKLYKVLQEVAKKNLMITDEASAFETMGYPIKVVQGSHQNVKLTYAEDLDLIESILASR